MEGAAGVQKSLSLPSLHGTSPRKKAAGRGSGKQRTRAGMLRSQSVEPRSAELSALALLCEAKLTESREAASGGGAGPDVGVVRACFEVLDRAAQTDSIIGGPLRSLTVELRDLVFAKPAAPGEERRPFFQLASELESEAERIIRNTAQLTAQIQAQAVPGGGAEGGGAEGPGSTEERKRQKQTQARILHLETEMHHMYDSIVRANKHIDELKGYLHDKSREIFKHRQTIEAMRFEGRGIESAMKLAEGQAEALQQQLTALEFENVSMGFGGKNARTQLDETAAANAGLEGVIAEKNAEIRRGEEEREWLSSRVQELKKSILDMVPKLEVESTRREIGALREGVREAQRETQKWQTKYEEVSGTADGADAVIDYMTPRPDWSNIEQYAIGSEILEGKSSAELVEELYKAIDEARGLTGIDAAWEEDNDSFEGLGKGDDIPMYLHWVGEVRNRHYSKLEMDKFIGEVFVSKKDYEKKRGKPSTLSAYMPTFLTEKYGIQARVAEFGYNMMDALERLGPTEPMLEQFNMCLHEKLEVAVLDKTMRLPARCIALWEKIDVANNGKVSHKLSKAEVLSSLFNQWPMVEGAGMRRIKQMVFDASLRDTIRYSNLVDIADYNASGLAPAGSPPLELGERTPIVQILEDAIWHDRKKYLQEIVVSRVMIAGIWVAFF